MARNIGTVCIPGSGQPNGEVNNTDGVGANSITQSITILATVVAGENPVNNMYIPVFAFYYTAGTKNELDIELNGIFSLTT